ncbi:hypothetical protein DFQ04_3189 [Algoriphagus boseongensis]|uniref:ParE-like toxin of type II ParDE toxin-antitoxin system n=1 Tax=Algoriphagus boseongensis TaxID=1442587 RepID=A0A4R6T208_9BACT|nr:hypothetical protein [Algoriphagus boseongensis]TDQ14601.1 hypothetical protein DFQ04_3189 [Algoriphagus boseongensis]
MAERERFKVILTRSSILRFKDEIFPYLLDNFTAKRVLEIEEELFEKVDSLEFFPYRSTREASLIDDPKEFRFLLYQASQKFELKILFYIDELEKKVYVTDFFHTLKDPSKIKSN